MKQANQIIPNSFPSLLKVPAPVTCHNNPMRTAHNPRSVAAPKLHSNSLLFRGATTAPISTNRPLPFSSHKRLALMQHPLWVSSLQEWWNTLDPHNSIDPTSGFLTKEQYLDLNLRLQKALTTRFEYEPAVKSAEEDWTINSEAPEFDFDEFSEFLYEMSEQWAEGSGLQGTLLLVNGLLLWISEGIHLNTSVLKELCNVSTVPEQLFEVVAEAAADERVLNNEEEFVDWYKGQFKTSEGVKAGVCRTLLRVFPGESRVKDIWREEVTQNTSDALLACIHRLEQTLNKVTQITVRIPEKTTEKTHRIQGHYVPPPPRFHCETLPPHKQEPVQLYNRIQFKNEVKLSLVGFSSKAPKEDPKEDPKQCKTEKSLHLAPNTIPEPKLEQHKKTQTSKLRPTLKRPRKAGYSLEQYSHLIKDQAPEFSDNFEFFCYLTKAKHNFNNRFSSPFTRYVPSTVKYRSRRDELGGAITDSEWATFMVKLKKLLKLKRRRRRCPRVRRLRKDRLWRSVFLHH